MYLVLVKKKVFFILCSSDAELFYTGTIWYAHTASTIPSFLLFWQESCRPVNTFLTFEGDSESLLHSTFIHNTSLLPKMSTRPWQDANNSLFVLWPWCKAIRVHTPPDLIDTFLIDTVNTEAESLVASNLKPRVILAPCKASMIVYQ